MKNRDSYVDQSLGRYYAQQEETLLAYERYQDMKDAELLNEYLSRRGKKGLDSTIRDVMVQWLVDDDGVA